MNLLLSIDKMTLIKILFLSGALCLSLFLFVANWLYLVRTRSAAHLIDLDPPANIDHLLKTSMAIAFVCIVCILGLFLTHLY